MGLERVVIDIKIAEWDSIGGLKNERQIESLIIRDNYFVQADLSLILDMEDNEFAYYEFTGYGRNNNVVIDRQFIGPGTNSWNEVCRQTCSARWYGWTLVAYQNPASNMEHRIEILPGTLNGEALRVYIRPGTNPSTGNSYWNEFTDQFDPYLHF